MRFFEQQAQAKAKTSRLIVLYALGVLLLGCLSASAVHFSLNLDGESVEELGEGHWSLVATAAIGTWGVILLGSALRTMRLGQGGKVVAESLGGVLLGPQTSDLKERQALNVVEEMALASGMPVPPVYILRREPGINAFAAGWSPDDAVIGLTQGALTELNRSELQGVVAHEFSHILNRDSALNMRMLGVLHGIVALSLVGRFLTETRDTNRRRDVGPLVLIGIAFWILGSVGAFIAELIQAAVSREREYLADASAVQFTRDTQGIAGALAKIGVASSYLQSPMARPTNHLLIAEATAGGLFDLSSHPPLKARIQRLIPRWNGDFVSLAGRISSAGAQPSARAAHNEARAVGFAASEAEAREPVMHSNLEENSAESLFANTPVHMVEGAREPYFARLLILAACLDENMDARNAQLANIELSDRATASLLPSIYKSYWRVPGEARLPLVELALGTLAALSHSQMVALSSLLEQARVGLSSYAHQPHAVLSLALRHLRAPSQNERAHVQGKKCHPAVAAACLLGVVARRGQENEANAASAFELGKKRLAQERLSVSFPPARELTVDCVDEAISALLTTTLSQRRAILDALELVASFDGVVKPLENELIHTFAVCLHVATAIGDPHRKAV